MKIHRGTQQNSNEIGWGKDTVLQKRQTRRKQTQLNKPLLKTVLCVLRLNACNAGISQVWLHDQTGGMTGMNSNLSSCGLASYMFVYDILRPLRRLQTKNFTEEFLIPNESISWASLGSAVSLILSTWDTDILPNANSRNSRISFPLHKPRDSHFP